MFSPNGGEGHEVAWGVRVPPHGAGDHEVVVGVPPLRLCRTPPVGENQDRDG